ncbi:dihydroxyacetone kinase subunit DhaL [Corticibacterium sp. UT-5YL-CI-8]|nr:dihydroxyacetone kinase subunit DhaL [Tianweitania sp. UT-5YL-CI-8]
MKKLINDPKYAVPEMLEGLVRANPTLALLDGENVVLRSDAAALRERNEVALVSGGGAGHEPAHAGYVGAGLLTAAVSGDVFSSPSTDAVLSAIRAVGGPAGVLLIVKNYTGDRLNFGLAAELGRLDGIPVEMVLVGDDVALGTGGHAGRRGVAGTVLVHKVAGAAAAAGLSLSEVKAEAEAAARAVGTMGVALSGCTVPGVDEASFDLGHREVELGLGIHGEPGVERTRLVSADAFTDRLIDAIVEDKGLAAGDEVALLVNNLGATPTMELNIVARRAFSRLSDKRIKVKRVLCGTFLTALDMAGCSLSLIKLDAARLARLDASANAPAWPASPLSSPTQAVTRIEPDKRSVDGAGAAEKVDVKAVASARRLLRHVIAAVRNAEGELTALDRTVGDGDLGISLTRGVDALERQLSDRDLAEPSKALRAISGILRKVVGGTSGPLYAIATLRASEKLRAAQSTDAAAWSEAFDAACSGIADLGGAKVGDRTMLDALVPAAVAFREAVTHGNVLRVALEEALAAARTGAATTAALLPRRGRSSYLGTRAVGHSDPGAEAVVIWLEGLRQALAQRATLGEKLS